MTEPEEPTVTDVPEPDQDPHEPAEEEQEEQDESEVGAGPDDPVAPHDDVEIERAFSSLQKEATRHANRISQIMGADAQLLQPCPRCVTSDPQRPAVPGFIFPNEMVPLLPEDKAKVKLSIGEGAEPEYRQNDDAFQCQKCAGMGEYETGSHVRSQRRIQCDTCSGRGWIGQRALGATPAMSNGVVEQVPVGVGAEEPKAGADPWGRLPGDPHYGVLPGYEG